MGSLTEPIRQILLDRHQTHQSQFVEAKAVGLDREARKVQCVDSNGRSFLVEYDHLIIGVGANNNTFNTPGVKQHAFFLKEAKHARLIRSRILSHFERAASPTTSLAEKEALLQFVVVGGGPTGVEFAGELIDFLDSDLSKQFPSLIPLVRVRLIQSNEHILNTYDAAISAYAEEKFKQLRIQVITNARVSGITSDSLTFTDKVSKATRTIPFGICVWSTGIEMNDFTRKVASTVLGQESDKALVTDEHLRILQQIPQLDRVPTRIVEQAAREIAPAGSANKKPTIAATTPSSTTAAAPASANSIAVAEVNAATIVPSDNVPAARDLDVDGRVYAIGDCATTYIPRLSKRIRRIFEAADRDGDGVLSYAELRELCLTLSEKVPVMSAQMSLILANYIQVEHTPTHEAIGGVNLDQFRAMLQAADKNVRAYPATAQVASQQGKYLARRFNAFAKQMAAEGKLAAAADRAAADEARGLDHLQIARQKHLILEQLHEQQKCSPGQPTPSATTPQAPSAATPDADAAAAAATAAAAAAKLAAIAPGVDLEDLQLPGLDLAAATTEGGGVFRRPIHPPVCLPELTDRAFRYRHLGNLAYIGGETAAIDLGGAGTFTGMAAFWLWKSAYLNEAVSTRTRLNLAYDWMKTFFFGRDTSKP